MASLSHPDRDLWRGFRRTYEQVSLAVERDLAAATELSAADHGILSRLAEAGPLGVRQHELALAMRWDRTRLSHHLTRMEQRQLLTRSKNGERGTHIVITAQGDAARKAADPVHDEAVTRHFIANLSMEQRDALTSLAARLSSTTTDRRS